MRKFFFLFPFILAFLSLAGCISQPERNYAAECSVIQSQGGTFNYDTPREISKLPLVCQVAYHKAMPQYHAEMREKLLLELQEEEVNQSPP